MATSNEKLDELTERYDLQQRVIYKMNRAFDQHQDIFTKFFQIKKAKKKMSKRPKTPKQKTSPKRKVKKPKILKKIKGKKRKVSHKLRKAKKRIKKYTR